MRNLLFVALAIVCFQPAARCQETMVPAGTLLHCTMDDPNFSAKTAQIGDPVLCHLNALTEFGHPVFPRGSYLAGHLEEAKQPGRFVGKGNMKIVFDRIGLPDADEEMDAKIVAAPGQKVNNRGEIVGHGHAKRDVAEWLFPPLWPWKVLMLPARGPQPALKSEQAITLRLMEDVEVPQLRTYGMSSQPSDWRHLGNAGPSARTGAQSYGPRPSGTSAGSSSQPAVGGGFASRVYYASPSTPAAVQPAPASGAYSATTSVYRAAPSSSVMQSSAGAAQTGTSVEQPKSSGPAGRVTLVVLKSQTIYPTTEYWVAGQLLCYVLPDGSVQSTNLNAVDWQRTMDLNGERGVRVTLRTKSQGF